MTSPILPSPTRRPSILVTGATCTPVPHRKTSSATYSSERSTRRSTTGMASRSASSKMALRVIPTRMSSDGAGVTSFPSITRNRLAALPSETCPSPVSRMASSKPASWASAMARAALMYPPVALARAGMALSSLRRHPETVRDSPLVMSKYWPIGALKQQNASSRWRSPTLMTGDAL